MCEARAVALATVLARPLCGRKLLLVEEHVSQEQRLISHTHRSKQWIAYVPQEVNLEDWGYCPSEENRLLVTDGKSFRLDVNEFSGSAWSYSRTCHSALPIGKKVNMRLWSRNGFLWLLVVLLLAGCTPAANSGQRTPAALATFTPTATPAATPTPAVTPTATSTPRADAIHPVLTWLREGGIAGFCDAVSVYGDGRVEVSWCRGNRLRERKSLSMEQQAQLQAWVKTYAAFEYEQRDQAVADSMRVRLTLAGQGGQTVSDAERQAMLDWASTLVSPRSSEGPPPQLVENATPGPAPAGLVYRAGDAVWSIDANGQHRLLTHYGDALPAPDLARALYWDGAALWMIDLRTGTRRQIPADPFVLLGGGTFHWADADTVLLSVLKDPSEEMASLGYLAVFEVSSGELTLLDPEHVSLSLPAASPDGQTIAYDAGGRPQLVHRTGGVLPFEPERFEGLPASETYAFGSPAWSPDGRKLAWMVSGAWGTAILIFDLDAQIVQMLHPFQPLGTGAMIPAPVWSPDGRWLALTIRANDTAGSGTWLLAADGSLERLLSSSTLANPIWTGDGQLIWNDYDEQAGTPNVVKLLDLTAWMQHALDLPAGGMAIGWSTSLAPETTEDTVVRYVLALKDVIMYSGPGTNHETIGSVFDGQVAWVTGQSMDGAWWRVICPNDTVGDCWVSADPEWTEPTTPPGAWPIYMLASGVSVEYPVGWSPSPGGYDGTQESVWFVSPDTDVAPVAVEVYHRPLSERDIADPYTWQPNEGGYEVHWARPLSTVGGLSGLEFVWGAYSEPQEQWDTPPSLITILYSPEHELEVRLTTSFDPPALDMLQTAGFTETVTARFGVLRRMAQSLRAYPTAGWETYQDTEADGLFELKHPPGWTVQGSAMECGTAYDLESLKLLVFEGCWSNGVGSRQLTFFDTLRRFRSAFGGEVAASRHSVNGMEVEVVHYRAAADNGIAALDPGPGTVALWQVGEQGYALIDPGNQHQRDGAFDGVLGSFLLLPPMPRGEPRLLDGRSVEGGTAFDLPGVGATIVLPAGYGVVTNNEYNRRGSLISFDFTPYGGERPRFAEIQFFSEASIRTFHERCAIHGGFCFEGDYPDVERYQVQKDAMAECTNLAPYEAMQFDGRCYLVADHRCTGDACVLREYTTFLDDTMVSVLIVMQDPSQVNEGDRLFASFSLSASLPTTGSTSLAGSLPERFLRIDQAGQRMYAYENGIPLRELPVSTGRPTSVTLTRAWKGTVGGDLGSGGVDGGMFADFKWFLFQDLYGSVLIHSVPYTRRGEDKVYDQLDALGIRPASRGCVRISPEDAEWLKMWNPVGVPIEITALPGPIEQVTGA